MIHTTNPSKLIRDTYSETVVDALDMTDISNMIGEFNYEDSKLVLNGNELLKRNDIQFPDSLSEEKKELRFLAKYKIYEKPKL